MAIHAFASEDAALPCTCHERDPWIPARDELTGAPDPNEPIGSVTRWPAVAEVVAALARAGATGRPGWPDAVERMVLGLTEPLRHLDELAAIADRSLAGDRHATCDLKAKLEALSAVSIVGAQLVADAEAIDAGGSDCGCGCGGSEPAPDALAEADGRSPSVLGPVLDESAVTAVTLAALNAYGADVDGGKRAAGIVLGLAASALPLTNLAAAHQRAGRAGLLDRLDRYAAQRAVEGVTLPPTMHTMSGGLQMPGIPGLPGGRVPGIPGGGIPGSPHDPGNPEDYVPGFVKDLLDKLRDRKKRWDPESWDHATPLWPWPQKYIDPDEIAAVRCLLAVNKLIAARNEAPPARTGKVVWSDTITSVTQTGVCAGSTITIHGSGFGATKPANVDVSLPTQSGDKGCRPAGPFVTRWTDTEVDVAIFAGTTSGTIGFVDLDYVAAYDDWATRMNAINGQILALRCGPSMKVTWVPLFNECAPATPVNTIKAGVPVITAFTANGDTLTAVEPGDPVTLRWTVSNADHVRIDRTSGFGPTFGGSTALVDPAGTTVTLPAPNHAGPVTMTYELTATTDCASVTRTVTVVGGKRPNITISSVEVTQSIQTTAADVVLVESKPTVLRATVNHGLAGWGANAVPNVTGRVRVHRGNQTSGWFDPANGTSPMAAKPGAAITVSGSPQRNTTDDTLNFLIPPAWCSGTVYYELEAKVTGFGATGGFAGYDDSARFSTSNRTFQHRRTLELRYVRVNWGGNTPTDQRCRDTLRTAVPLLPTPTANIAALGGVGIQTPGGTGDDDRDDLLEEFDDRHNCSWWESLWEWLGADCPDDDGAIWVLIPGVFHRGRAYDIPSNVCFTPPDDGRYAAHEISHCLDQKHVSVMCANGQQATGGDPPSAWPNNAQLQDVPFDVATNAALTLAGTGVFDVMTYCGTNGNTWPMPARWQALYNAIGG